MLQWEIDGKVRWLCTECTRENSHIFLLHDAKFLGEEADADHVCYCCRCGDQMVNKYGGWRWFYYAVCSLFGVPAPERAKALRRAK